jgi:hypothetical protein
MAITINQAPTTPNAVYTNLIHAVSSDQVNNPQFQYVMDIVSGSSVLSRIRQYPNPAGTGIFDPSRILRDYLEYDLSWTTDDFTPTEAVKTFTINFGEEYGTSPSSSVVLYNGAGGAGNPSITDGALTVFSGMVDPNNGISYNWQDNTSAVILTDRPSNIPVSSTDIFSVTAYNGTGGSQTLSITGGEGGSVGPGEFKSFVLTPSGNKTISYAGRSITIPVEEECNYERTNFAFINNYGFWDYYGFNLPTKKNTNIQRKSFVKPFVDYSSVTSPYNVNRRGTDIYNVSYMDNISVSTPYLLEDEAEWVAQMIESPEVFIQQGSVMVPITITNSSYTHNTNIRSQKAFQYEISYQYANQRQTR